MTQQDEKNLIHEIRKCAMNDKSGVLGSLKNLFLCMDMLNNDYRKEFGEDSPYLKEYVNQEDK